MGETLETITQTMGSVVEGVPTTKAVKTLAEQYGVDMPISTAMHSVLFEGLPIQDALNLLMSRDLRSEQLRG
jgi:glycerol-3-phosphate dehydrogenase (NAD(P)+)